jgi:hypothetical protein
MWTGFMCSGQETVSGSCKHSNGNEDNIYWPCYSSLEALPQIFYKYSTDAEVVSHLKWTHHDSVPPQRREMS